MHHHQQTKILDVYLTLIRSQFSNRTDPCQDHMATISDIIRSVAFEMPSNQYSISIESHISNQDIHAD